MSAELIHQMYIAYYQRPADPAGLIYWQDQLNANGGGEAGWNAVAAAFANAAESSALYGNQTLAQKISAIYLAAFERAASADEVAYWEASGFNAAQIGFAIVNGAQNDDLQTVDKKVDYAEAFVSTLDPAGTGVGPFAFQYVDPSLGRDLMDVITKDSNVSAATVSSQVSSTLPTLNTVNLTSGADTVTPKANAAEEINAALGGSSPSLDRTDSIDGGSAQDTINVAMDGNFLLGFSSGTMTDVEIVNLAATASSVTPKTFNFTGSSGIETINVGVGNAPIIISNISDTGLTVNLSGQSTGAFDVGFASGTISGSGSALTMGLTDVGSTGTNVSLTSNLITDLDIVSYGTSNHITLDGSVNDIKNISVAGAGDLVIGGIPSTASGFTAASAGGDVTLTVDTDSNTVMLASGQTITGGAGFDSLSVQGSGIAAMASTSIEELIFDGSTSEAIVRATGMAGLNTLTFSGQGTNAPSISGISDQALTVNAILDSTADQQQNISGSGAVTVNLNGNPTQVALGNVSDNDFDFKATTTAGVDINIGPLTSASGTYTINNSTGAVGITVDATSVFGGHLQASGAETISILGSGVLGGGATVSGQNTTSITVNANSGTLALGSSAANTLTFNSDSNLTVTGRASNTQTLTVNVGKNTADLSDSNLTFVNMQTVSLSGAGTGATVLVNGFSGSANNMVLTMSGLEGGVSAASVVANSGSVTISAEAMTGKLNTTTLQVTGAGNLTVSTGTSGQFSANTVDSTGTFTLDQSANVAGSASLTLGAVSASGAISISGPGGSGDITIASVTGHTTFTLDASNFGGSIDLANASVGGNVTVSVGSEGHFSASVIGTNASFTLDAANASTGQITSQKLSAGGGITVSMGTGTGGITMVSSVTNGNFTLDASNFGGTIDINTITASGAVVVSMGTTGDFSADDVATAGAFTLDGAAAVSGAVMLNSVTAGGNATISMGSGTGSLTVTNLNTLGNFTLDASKFGGAVDVTTLSASGALVLSMGTTGDFSASHIAGVGAVTLDGGASTTGQVTITGVTAGGNVTVSMGAGTGSLTMASSLTLGSFTIDATNFGGAVDATTITASGAVIFSLGSAGDLSAHGVHTTGAFTVDGAAATTGQVTANAVSASGAITISMGAGSGSLAASTLDTASTLTIDTTNYNGTIDTGILVASGAGTISMGGGDFSGSAISMVGNFTLDSSTSTTGSITMVAVSAGGNVSVTLGGGSGSFALTGASAMEVGGTFTLDGTRSSGTIDMKNLSASGAITLTLDGGDRGAFSAQSIQSNKSITITQEAAGSGTTSIQGISASGNITINLGTGTGSGNITMSSINTAAGFSLTGEQNADIDIENTTVASGLTITNAGEGTLDASALNAASLSITKGVGSGETVTFQTISSNGVASITLSGASGTISASTIQAGGFTLDTSNLLEDTTTNFINTLSVSGDTNISLGAGGLLASSITVQSAGITLTKGAGSSDLTINTTLAVSSDIGSLTTINGAGSGSFVISAITTTSGFLFNGENMSVTSGDYFSAETLTNTSADVTFNFGQGSAAFFEVSALNSNGAFNITGTNLATGNITIADLSAQGNISIELGGMSGSATISAIDSEGTFTLNAGGAANLAFNAEHLSASAATITLGAVSDAAMNNSISALNVSNAFTLNGSAYREGFSAQTISASAISVTFGDLADFFFASSVTAQNFTFVGGDGANFSAEMSVVVIEDADWSITMPELGNGLTIDNLTFSASGTIVGTNSADNVSASSTSAAGDTLKFEFNLGEDNVQDDIGYNENSGKSLVKIINFDTGSDKLSTDHERGTGATAVGTTTAASIIGGALGATIAASDVASGAATALFTYNGDTFFIGAATGNAVNSTFEDGETVFQFVGTTSIVAGDIIAID